jgi:hypothetical protein
MDVDISPVLSDRTLAPDEPFDDLDYDQEIDAAPHLSQSTQASDLIDPLRQAKRSTKVLGVLDYLQSINLSLAEFLYALFYGDEGLRNNRQAIIARKNFSSDPLLAATLENMLNPPRRKSKGSRADTIRHVLRSFTFNSVAETLETELDRFAASQPNNRDDTAALLNDVASTQTLGSILEDLKKNSPWLLLLLERLGRNAAEKKNEKGLIDHSVCTTSQKISYSMCYKYFRSLYQLRANCLSAGIGVTTYSKSS